MKTSERVKRYITRFVLISFIVPVVFLAYMVIVTPNDVVADGRQRSDYLLMLVQCLLGIVALVLPTFLSKKASLEIPSNMYMVFVIFLYCAIFLGEVRDFYYTVPHWDTILHAMSGAMLGALGFSFVDILNKNRVMSTKLSPAFVAVFAFTFALSLGVFWEIYEFLGDSLLGLNMQKFRLSDGTELVGQSALADTMKDIIVDAISAFVICVVGYFALKHKAGWFDKLKIRLKGEA